MTSSQVGDLAGEAGSRFRDDVVPTIIYDQDNAWPEDAPILTGNTADPFLEGVPIADACP